jgi:hypothetical protein
MCKEFDEMRINKMSWDGRRKKTGMVSVRNVRSKRMQKRYSEMLISRTQGVGK